MIIDINIIDNGVVIKNKVIEVSDLIDVIFVVDYLGLMLYNFDVNELNDYEWINVLRLVFRKLYDIIMNNSNINVIGYIFFLWGIKRIVFEN